MKNSKVLKKIIIILLLFSLNSVLAFAHPHMWFTSEVEFVFEKKKIEGAFVTWTFDKEFSYDIITGYDLNSNGKFDIRETMEVYNNAFTYTKNYNYFLFIREGKTRTSPKHIARSRFSVRQKQGVVSYRFFVDLSEVRGHEFYFACYDYTFFCDITYHEKAPVSFMGNGTNIKPCYTIEENRDYPVYYNPMSPFLDTRVYKKWRPGLATYYPKEIKINY